MRTCFFIGAGGMGRDTITWAEQMADRDWRIGGFLDRNPDALAGKKSPYPVVGDSWNWAPEKDQVFVCTIGIRGVRMAVISDLQSRGAEFVSVIHPTVVRSHGAEVGCGCIIAPYSVLGSDSTIEDFAMLNMGCTIGHDSRIGEGAILSCQCDVMGYALVGKEAFLGGLSAVLPGRRVGDHAVVGAGAVVVRDVEPGEVVAGGPARRLGGHRLE